ncbi:AMP-binding protein [Shivajiella indica]|uniref:AMP-binding protein n=1 Tax=Shivajiella indica TaxID=872115 RepID=A0ABW5BBI2_9BACT
MFLDLQLFPEDKIALIDDKKEPISFKKLIEKSEDFYSKIRKRTLVFILADNSIESFVAYYSCLSNGIVPLLLNYKIDADLLTKLITKYEPECLFFPKTRLEELSYDPLLEYEDFVLVKTGFNETPLNSQLALLLPTSGSTGSPKLVRHSLGNLEFSATTVGQVFSIGPDDVAIAFLPMYYTMGLSVINSHLKAGAKVVLTNRSLTDREFWNTMREEKVTSFTGVPYSFEILDKLRFSRMQLPDLKIITQGGGKLKEDLFEKFALLAEEKNVKFIPTYGQTEGSARMAFLSPEKVLEKKGSIGKAIPSGYLSVINDNGDELKESGVSVEGEMIYKGPNVTMGYAENIEDLLKGDENFGFLKTGDIVRRDEEGYFFIIGRKKRFLKIFGLRVSLDEIEGLVKSRFHVECVCSGSDDQLIIAVNDPENHQKVKEYVSSKTGLFHGVIQVVYQAEFKRNETGKIILNDF